MHSQLVIVHRKKPDVFNEIPAGWRDFVTCLRSLAISFSHQEFSNVGSTDQIFRGLDAYRFLLEVACGLQSPILGETEVFGQFRKFADAWTEHAAFFQNVYSDVKTIRQRHLSHLGSQSYGSWVRKVVAKGESVHIVGTGQLAQEIQVWLSKQNQVCLYSRTPLLAAERLRGAAHANSIEIRSFRSAPLLDASVVVIAAPLQRQEIHEWLGNESPRLLIDLRDDSSSDRIETSGRCFRLQDIFAEIESGRSEAHQKISQARQLIDAIVAKRFQSQVIRPFGWDDLCA